MEECIFCKIAKKEAPANLEYEGKEVVAFKDIYPKADIHILVVPKKHIASFHDLKINEEAEVLKEMAQVLQDLINKLGVAKTGYKLIFYGGRYQHVPHLHWHLMGDAT